MGSLGRGEPGPAREPQIEANQFKETGEVLLARIKEVAKNCPPVYIEPLVTAYGRLIDISEHC